MIRSTSTVNFAAGFLLGLAALSWGAAGAAFAQTSTLDLPLDTGMPPGQAAERAPAVAPTPPVRRNAPPALASRGSIASRVEFRQEPAQAPPTVLAQLGLVAAGEAQIRIARDFRSQLLSVASKGTYLAVVSDGGDFWGVLMVNNTMGWVPKASLQMVDYQTEVRVPTNPRTEPAPATGGAAGSVAGMLGSLPRDMEPRTVSLLRSAFSYLGVPYVWAGNTRRGIDCSGFVCNVFSTLGVRLPRHSGDQARVGQFIQGDQLRPGDRLYFDMGNKGAISHCGIYIGNGLFIHASTNHGRVDIDSIFKPNYYKALICARRS